MKTVKVTKWPVDGFSGWFLLDFHEKRGAWFLVPKRTRWSHLDFERLSAHAVNYKADVWQPVDLGKAYGKRRVPCPKMFFQVDPSEYRGSLRKNISYMPIRFMWWTRRKDGTRWRLARGNYGINAGPDRGCFIGVASTCNDGFHVDDTDIRHHTMVVWGSGFAGFNYSTSLRDITNGTAHMVAVDELRAGVHPADPRGSWALGFPGASMTFRHGVISKREDAHGPNNPDPDSDDIVGCHAITVDKGVSYLVSVGMPCHANIPEMNVQATSRSMHPGGVNVLLVDGAVRFVSDSINPEIWYSLHSVTSTPAEDW